MFHTCSWAITAWMSIGLIKIAGCHSLRSSHLKYADTVLSLLRNKTLLFYSRIDKIARNGICILYNYINQDVLVGLIYKY